MSDDPATWDEFAATVIVTWDPAGLPRVLSGVFADRIGPSTLHVITAWNPDAEPAEPAVNATAHRRLVESVEALGLSWDPAVGASPDGGHHELGIVTGDLSRADAIAFGAELHQLAVFELDDDHVAVVPCDGRPPLIEPRSRPLERVALTFDQVNAWRAEHEVSTGHPLPRTHCPACDAPDPQRILYGMTVQMPPDWITLGGCIMGPDNPHRRCRTCDYRW